MSHERTEVLMELSKLIEDMHDYASTLEELYFEAENLSNTDFNKRLSDIQKRFEMKHITLI